MTILNPDKLCNECKEFDKIMNGGPASNDVFVLCDHIDDDPIQCLRTLIIAKEISSLPASANCFKDMGGEVNEI